VDAPRDRSLARDGAVGGLEWTQGSALAVMALTPAITLVGFLMARRVAAVRHVDVRVADLPAALEGFTIAQITDIHVGPTIKGDFVQRVVEHVVIEHGGQFWPWNHFVRMQQPFTAGLHRLGRMWVYISRGTGCWGPPMRFGIPSEITRIRLVRA
jgi:predicted MPP superfamily phosphohydrolase